MHGRAEGETKERAFAPGLWIYLKTGNRKTINHTRAQNQSNEKAAHNFQCLEGMSADFWQDELNCQPNWKDRRVEESSHRDQANRRWLITSVIVSSKRRRYNPPSA